MEALRNAPRFRLTPHLVLGLAVIVVGILFTLDNLDIADGERYLRYWPVAVIVVGVVKLLDSRGGRGNPIGGTLFTLVGTWLLLDSLGYVTANLFDFWPLLLVFVGGVMVWHSLRRPHALSGGPAGGASAGIAPGNDTIYAIAVLSGVNRGSNSTAFRGGELTAFMGGVEVDLRNAAINGDAVMDVFAMWGGIAIRVPENWTVIGKVTPLMGGFDDQTRAPQVATTHRLTLRGMVIMGGVEIKN